MNDDEINQVLRKFLEEPNLRATFIGIGIFLTSETNYLEYIDDEIYEQLIKLISIYLHEDLNEINDQTTIH